MHEFSIILNIVEIAEEIARDNAGKKVESIELDIGALSGVDYDAFDFAWDAAVRETLLENSKRLINKIPGKAKCSNCNTAFELQNWYDPCPKCKEVLHEIMHGRELQVKQLILI